MNEDNMTEEKVFVVRFEKEGNTLRGSKRMYTI